MQRRNFRCVNQLFCLLVSVALVSLGCESGKKSGEGSGGSSSSGSSGTPKVEIEFPDGDPSVKPADGGPGFEGGGEWQTADVGRIGSPDAVRGGVISSYTPSWPENLRRFGTGSNTWLNYAIRDLCYEGLCGMHPETLETTPGLASHWQISEDKMTFRFRINPKAHWSDGKPVVAQDWIATYQLVNDDSLVDPMMKEVICSKMEEPVALSKYVLEIKCKEKDWRNFLAIMAFTPLPAHEIEGMSGADFLKKYNFNFTATTGPYIIHEEDIKKNESLTLTRRTDYWAEEEEATKGLYNFDKIRFVVIRDQRLAFDKACKGELDFYPVYTAKWWVEDVTPLEAYKNGQLIRTEIFTKFPKAFQGLAFNMRKEPVDDVRVRKALAMLYDRKTLLKKFAYDQYTPLQSYYPGGDAENPDNVLVDYDPEGAIELFKEAGWTERDSDGVLMKDGKRMSIEIIYRTQGFEKYFTSYQEACRQVGVEINLKLITPETHWKNMQERTFQTASMAWGAILFPNPKSSWGSDMADKSGSNNITGFKNERVDELIELYNAEFDPAKRSEYLREMDGIIYKQYPYSLDWYNPCERILYWNKFGLPDFKLPKYGEYESAFTYWWYDKDKAAELKKTLKSGTKMQEVPKLQHRPWDDA